MSNDMTDELEEWANEWIQASVAAREVKTNPGKISQLIRQGKLQTQEDPLDARVTLVQRREVYQLFRKKLVRK